MEERSAAWQSLPRGVEVAAGPTGSRNDEERPALGAAITCHFFHRAHQKYSGSNFSQILWWSQPMLLPVQLQAGWVLLEKQHPEASEWPARVNR